ncbi:hypothetical protein [Paenibacillus polymyxa]|uniref:hypothetical protein n=1 Tax=Paenibacillus polymyxa TaxID=1406 RepID=UPI0007EA7F19|nr:hypothetical protein [Paenibacillus polymyxa]OAZ43368.1 hypothetical protein A9Z39_22275 [Paenibacillus polymyxa]
MKSFRIRIITKFNTKNELFIPGEVHEARRISYNLMDFKTPFQIVSGKKSGEEVPFKYAVVLSDKPQPTQQQFDRLVEQNRELLDKLERHTDEQLNTEKLLQRIRELETIANERDEMIKSIKSVSVVIRDKRNPVEVPRDVAKALDWCRWNGVDNDEIVRNLATGINGPIMNVLRSYVHEGGNGNNLLCALLNGYTTESENNELADEIDSLTSVWFHNVVKSSGDIESTRQDLNKVIYEFMRGLDKTAV